MANPTTKVTKKENDPRPVRILLVEDNQATFICWKRLSRAGISVMS
jgi:hypothetical protein